MAVDLKGRGISAAMLEWIGTFPVEVKQHPAFRETVDRYAAMPRDDLTRGKIIGEIRSIMAPAA